MPFFYYYIGLVFFIDKQKTIFVSIFLDKISTELNIVTLISGTAENLNQEKIHQEEGPSRESTFCSCPTPAPAGLSARVSSSALWASCGLHSWGEESGGVLCQPAGPRVHSRTRPVQPRGPKRKWCHGPWRLPDFKTPLTLSPKQQQLLSLCPLTWRAGYFSVSSSMSR